MSHVNQPPTADEDPRAWIRRLLKAVDEYPTTEPPPAAVLPGARLTGQRAVTLRLRPETTPLDRAA